MSVGHYVKRPIVVEACQWTGTNEAELLAWGADVHGSTHPLIKPVPEGSLMLWVEANQRWLPLELGEWVIRDRHGFYPCKADVFADTYVEAHEVPAEVEAQGRPA